MNDGVSDGVTLSAGFWVEDDAAGSSADRRWTGSVGEEGTGFMALRFRGVFVTAAPLGHPDRRTGAPEMPSP